MPLLQVRRPSSAFTVGVFLPPFLLALLDSMILVELGFDASRQVTPVTAGRSIATLICLRHTLRLLEPLTNALEVRCLLFTAVVLGKYSICHAAD